MRVEFTIPGNPVGWQRAGHSRKNGRCYTQGNTRQQENLAAICFRRQCAVRFPEKSAIRMTVTAYLSIPKSASGVKRGKMLAGKILPTVKPDWDNIGKLISDALNGVAYADDKTVTDARVIKAYSENPRTVVILEEVVDCHEG